MIETYIYKCPKCGSERKTIENINHYCDNKECIERKSVEEYGLPYVRVMRTKMKKKSKNAEETPALIKND